MAKQTDTTKFVLIERTGEAPPAGRPSGAVPRPARIDALQFNSADGHMIAVLTVGQPQEVPADVAETLSKEPLPDGFRWKITAKAPAAESASGGTEKSTAAAGPGPQ
jgi:hypothetical protein